MLMPRSQNIKEVIKAHWEAETCGTRYGFSQNRIAWMQETETARYRLEPHIRDFAEFEKARNKKLLEIGVGAGVDFLQWVKNDAHATGIDLTKAALVVTKERLNLLSIEQKKYTLLQADAENLPFEGNTFDIVYSWGVLHHTPDTLKALSETFRVLAPGGVLKIMLYHLPSWTAFLLWLQHGLLRGKPFLSFHKALFHYLESPGTKAYTGSQGYKLMASLGFENIDIKIKLSAGDLLNIEPSKKYQSPLYRLAWKFYPRWFVKMCGDRFGLELLIKATKPLLIQN